MVELWVDTLFAVSFILSFIIFLVHMFVHCPDAQFGQSLHQSRSRFALRVYFRRQYRDGAFAVVSVLSSSAPLMESIAYSTVRVHLWWNECRAYGEWIHTLIDLHMTELCTCTALMLMAAVMFLVLCRDNRIFWWFYEVHKSTGVCAAEFKEYNIPTQQSK